MWLAPSLIIVLAGIRVSLYNAITEEQSDTLVQYMNGFVTEETKATAA